MKILFPLLLIILVGSACKRIRWEYKIVKNFGTDSLSREGDDAFRSNFITPTESEFNALGKEGWELVSSMSEIETAFPNFGKAEYVTGLQPNVRSSGLVFIFKREVKK